MFLPVLMQAISHVMISIVLVEEIQVIAALVVGVRRLHLM